MDNNVAFLEYLASFWNAEAVKKVRDSRNEVPIHNFQQDEEFEKTVVSGDYKANPLLDAVIKLREQEKAAAEGIIRPDKNPKSRVPTDLTSIYNTLKKFNMGD